MDMNPISIINFILCYLSIGKRFYLSPDRCSLSPTPRSQPQAHARKKQRRGEISRVNLNAYKYSNRPSINLFKAFPSLNDNILELEKGGKKEKQSRKQREKEKKTKVRPHQRLVSLFKCTPLMLKHENRMGFGDVYAFAMLSRYVSLLAIYALC